MIWKCLHEVLLFISKSVETPSDICSRLKYDTNELGRELTEHVENLRSALEKVDMSKRFSTQSDSDS